MGFLYFFFRHRPTSNIDEVFMSLRFFISLLTSSLLSVVWNDVGRKNKRMPQKSSNFSNKFRFKNLDFD